VTLRVAQEDSTKLERAATITVVSGEQTLPLNIDVVRRTTVTGTVVAKDGCTVAIGGLINENLNDNRSQVPVLGKLPIIGILFRGQQTGRQRRELVVMIRPYVFNTAHESAAISRELIQELSAHPMAPDAVGTMNSFAPQEILVPHPPQSPLQMIFRFHSLEPKTY
jgi:general secretion pathway protein D